MMRGVLDLAGVLACVAWLVAGGCAPQPRAPRPGGETPRNILFIYADDQRADTIGAWGNEHIVTPHLDALAGRGFSFRRGYCLGGPHGAVCVPSRAMLLTGKAWFELDLGDFGGRTSLPEHLAAQGYRTFMTGKWHNGHGALRRCFPSAQAVMRAGMSDHYQVPLVDIVDGEFENERTGVGHSSEIFADEAVDFLERLSGDAPFFCYVALTAPHDPRDAPAAYRERFADQRPPLPPNFLPQHPFDNSQLLTRDEQLAPWPRTASVIRDQLAEYYALIEHMDAQVGRILAALEASGRGADTLVVYAADHGLALGSHGLLGKQNVYEHSMRAPIIVTGPGVPQGSSPALVYLHDLYPTLLRACGALPEDDCDGRDLAPLWDGEDTGVRDSLMTSQHHMRAVTDGRWKLIRYGDIDRTQLFDLDVDPHELHDLAADPLRAGELQRLAKLLQAWQVELGDPQPWTSAQTRSPEIDLSGHEREPDSWQPAWIREKYFGR